MAKKKIPKEKQGDVGGKGGGLRNYWQFSVFKEFEGVVLTENIQEKGVSRREGSEADRQTKEDYENTDGKTQ